MLRIALVLVLGLCAATVAALETPLTLASGSKVALIDPVSGSITIYEPSASKVDRLGLGKPSANFIADIEDKSKTFLDERDGVPFSWLRVGSSNNRPTYGEMFTGGKWLPNKPTRKEAAAGKADMQTRALGSENSFWKTNPTYDGVVRAAYLSSGRYLVLAVPSLHTLMVYTLDSDVATLTAFRNWGPELFITGLNTLPNPADFLSGLPADKLQEAQAALGLETDTATGGTAPPPIPLAQEEPPTPASDVWIAAGPSDSFLMVDVANQRAMLYQWNGKQITLNGVRDLAVDLVIPGLIGGAWHSEPSGDRLLDAALRSRKQYIAAYNLPTDKDELLLLVGQAGAKSKGKASTFEAVMNTNGIAMLNFVERRAFLVLDTRAGQSLALAASRDYTLDIAVAMLDQEINNRINAANLLKEAIRLAGQTQRKLAVLTLRRVLSLDPSLHKQAETKMKNAFRNDADLQAQFQALIDEAAKKADELAKQADERKKALEAKRNQQ